MDEGAWLEPGLEDRLARGLLADGYDAVATRFGEARLTAFAVLAEVSPATVATGIDLWTAAPVELPAQLTVSRDGNRVHVSLPAEGAPEVPPLVRPEYAAGWLSLVADPGPLLGLPRGGARAPEEDLLGRRAASFAAVQEHYYRDPPRIERGWRHHLAATDGRVYLDMVNNVTVLGHAHPRVEAAVARQLRRLNTNSRFNYASVVEFSERLAGLLPGPAGHRVPGQLGVRGGRPGAAAGPGGHRAPGRGGGAGGLPRLDVRLGRRVHLHRGQPERAEHAPALGARRRRAELLPRAGTAAPSPFGTPATRSGPSASSRRSGRPPAAFLAEPYYGNAGGMPLPDGYLAAVYAEVRRHGGLAIADEIQVGYGRLGHWFWGFEQQGVVPDVVTVAKAMGNGYPLGAVVTSRAIAARYRDAGYFFSSTGGSPVSSVVGLTVLDVIRDEGLQANAARVGAHLKARLEELAVRHSIDRRGARVRPVPRAWSSSGTAARWSPPPRRPRPSATGCSSSA